MGDPKRIRKKYKTPRQPFDKHRIENDLKIVGKYGLRNMKEAWKHSTLLRHFRSNARKLLSLDLEHRQIGEKELVGRLVRMGLLKKTATLDDVLSLQVENFLDRRLQTLVHKTGLATTPHHSRQLIVHGHISVGEHIVNSPSYFVNFDEEKSIVFSYASPYRKASHKALPANVYKSKSAEAKKPDRRRGPARPDRRRGPPRPGQKPAPAKPAQTKPAQKPAPARPAQAKPAQKPGPAKPAESVKKSSPKDDPKAEEAPLLKIDKDQKAIEEKAIAEKAKKVVPAKLKDEL
ncbi:MAG: 30S ribosomal protein S4 [Candidatus Heimdallarchaeota archaeon]